MTSNPKEIFSSDATTDGEEIAQNSAMVGKNPAAVALGRLGGMRGGHARAKTLTSERRSEIAKKAAHARWAKNQKGEE
ncbi:histone H1 [Burkholderia catarinensis]|uniref:histone H1 n=1 Tax=Burkholderia catarinensis TaxID=1108140 RepID=UPI0010081F66|nr:histone H1 [Burkholderia catarinensis]